MIGRRIEQHYGFGAARLAIRGGGFRVGDPDDTLRRAGAALLEDLRREGWTGALGLGTAPLLGLVLIALLALATILVGPPQDDLAIEMVPFDLAQRLPPPVVAEPVPPRVPEAAPPAAEPVLPPPAAEPPVDRKPPAPPPPVARTRPKPPPPVAPPVPERAVRPAPVRPATPRAGPPPATRPRVQIDRVATTPAPPAPSVERTRPDRSPSARQRVTVAPLAAAAAPVPSAATRAPRERFRTARSPAAPPGRRGPPVAVDPLPSTAASSSSAPTSTRSGRVAPVSPTAPVGRNARPDVTVAALAAPTAGGRGTSAAGPRARRVAPTAAPPAAAGPGRDTALGGVPLGSLAACRSDGHEDALKAQVVAAVTTQKECVSRAGHYRFLQVRNLNSFLMWVERAPGRGEADRCVELRHALDCLKRAKRTEPRAG